jgi:hypothetical protein
MFVSRQLALFSLHLEGTHKQTTVVCDFHNIHNKVGLTHISVFYNVVQSSSVGKIYAPRPEVVHDVHF